MIRYDSKFDQEIRRVIKNYNAKINRLEKSNKDVYVPSKFTRQDLKSLKETSTTRKEIREKLNELKLYSEKGGEKYTNYQNQRVSMSQLKTLKRYQRLNRLKLNKKMKELEEISTIPLPFNKNYIDLQEEYNKSYSVDDIERLYNKITDKQDRIWQENYIKIFLETSYVYGISHATVSEIRKKLASLTPSQFSTLLNKNRTLNSILYYYNSFLDIGYDNAIEYNTQMYENEINEIIRNLDTYINEL